MRQRKGNKRVCVAGVASRGNGVRDRASSISESGLAHVYHSMNPADVLFGQLLKAAI